MSREDCWGSATTAQMDAGRQWKARRDRWAPVTTRHRLEDAERVEAAQEAHLIWEGGNRG